MRRGCRPIALAVATVSCGPQVSVDDGGSTGAGTDASAAGTDGPGRDAGDAPTDASATADDSSGDVPVVCGDGVLAGDEACDDGNEDGFDGCSPTCQVSGTPAWSIPIDVGPLGFPIGLDARDGQAFAAAQQLSGDATSFDVRLVWAGRDGGLLGEDLDVGGFSDLDFVRQPIGATENGTVVAGYPVVPGGMPTRYVGELELGGAPHWEALPEGERWDVFYGTSAEAGGAFVLHSLETNGDTSLVLDEFSYEGALVRRVDLGVDPSVVRPLGRGALPPRTLPMDSVLTIDEAGVVQLHAIIPGGLTPDTVDSVLTADPSGPQPRAFGEAGQIRVWSETEVAVIDAVGHPQPPAPRTVPGEVLLSFLGGFAIVEPRFDGGFSLSVYGDDDVLRWSYDTEVRPAFARADGDEGLFVLYGYRPEDPQISLQYLVL